MPRQVWDPRQGRVVTVQDNEVGGIMPIQHTSLGPNATHADAIGAGIGDFVVNNVAPLGAAAIAPFAMPEIGAGLGLSWLGSPIHPQATAAEASHPTPQPMLSLPGPQMDPDYQAAINQGIGGGNVHGIQYEADQAYQHLADRATARDAQMQKLLAEGKTELLKEFVSNRTRRKFSAYLVLDKGKVGFEFEKKAPAAKKTAAKKKAEPEAAE